MTRMDRLIERLQASQGDIQAQSAVAAEFLLAGRRDAERAELTAALDAAAVLRWFDADLLGRVLDLDPAAAQRHYQALLGLPFIEPFPGRTASSRDLHEATRLGWRRKLAAEQTDRLRALSLKAAACFADDGTPAAQVEWIYQRLLGDPDTAAAELAALNRAWSASARPEDLYTLAARLRELLDSGLVRGRAELWCRLVVAWARTLRGEEAQMKEVAEAILEQARAEADLPAQAEAHCLYGDILRTLGQLPAARAAYEADLAISRRLAELDPGNAGWQRDLAGACVRMARLEVVLRQAAAALAHYREAALIFALLVERAPTHAQWRKEHEIVAGELAAFQAASGSQGAGDGPTREP